jgi:ubiquinone/menaquinone biosynthesis C-methylase UbiE
MTFGRSEIDKKFILNILKEHTPITVLELGAGGGRCMDFYKESQIENIFLNEINLENVSLLQKKIEDNGFKNVTILHSPSYSLSLEDKSVDMVLIPFSGIAEMSPLIFTLAEINRVLKDNGILYFNSLNPTGKITGALGLRRSSLNNWKETIYTETLPKKHIGPFEFEVIFEHQKKGSVSKFIIEQIHPDLSTWKNLLHICDFEIIKSTGNFDLDSFEQKHDLLQIVAQKKLAAENFTTSNAINVSKIYDDISQSYDTISGGNHYKVPEWMTSRLKDYRSHHPTVLDLACASGNLLEKLTQFGIIPSFSFGVDISPEMLKIARQKKLYDSLARIDLSGGFAEPKSMQFDIILAIGFMEFIENPILLLKDIKRLLKIGGDVLLTFEINTALQQSSVESILNINKHIRTTEDIKSMILDSNLELIDFSIDEAYTSPSTNKKVSYAFCHIRRTRL